MESKRVLCSSCDIYCQVQVDVEDGRVARVKALDPRPLRSNICMKGVHAPSGFAHPDRVLHPLRRARERGEGRWGRVTWDEALDEIAERLRAVVDRYGPESLAVATSQWNTQTENGAGRRFMNLLGTPNWISGVALCAGNTAAVNRMVYGWFPYPDYPRDALHRALRPQPPQAQLDPRLQRDPGRPEERGEAHRARPAALGERGARGPLAAASGRDRRRDVLRLDQGDPRRGAPRPGLRRARWTSGFDAFRRRVDEFPLDRVAAITGCDPEQIAAAARMYATNTPGVIPWTPITDQQRNSTSAIRLHCALRALTGSLDVPGGELMHGFHPDIVSESELELHEALPPRAEGEAARGRHPPRVHLPGDGAAWGARPARLGPRVPEPRHRLLHGEPDGDVPGDGDRRAVSRQGVLHLGEQHPDGVSPTCSGSTPES